MDREAESEVKKNSKIKDTVFSSLFYECENAVENAKELYKAITGKTVKNAEKCRLEDAVFRERMNDIAYIMDGKIVCFTEHQSTVNPNMPLRLLIYAARTYERNQLTGKDVLYSTRLVKIPVPEFYVLYNGKARLDETELKLSDAFMIDSEEKFLELTVKLTDINLDRIQDRPELLQCEPLYGYSYLIDKTRKYNGDTVQAVRDCEKNNILKEYLEHYGSEVINMLNIEYNADEAREYLVRESKAEGKIEGILSTLVGLVKDGILTLTDAAKRANMTVAEFESKTGIKA